MTITITKTQDTVKPVDYTLRIIKDNKEIIASTFLSLSNPKKANATQSTVENNTEIIIAHFEL